MDALSRMAAAHVLTLATTLCVSACARLPLSSTEDSAREVDVAVAAVVGGEPTGDCDWPSTVDVNGCTGTLIHPRIVTTAAHCLSGRRSSRVTFMAGNDKPGSFSLTAECKSGSRGFFGGGVGPNDWGYCVLPEDDRVAKLQVTPPLVGCEAERFLKPGASAWVVGFGTTGSGLNDNGIKREVEVKINKVSNGMIDIGDKDVGACHGDSGGPLYVRLNDGVHDWGYRVAGSTSGAGGNCDCTCSTVYVDIAAHVKAIEETEGIDVTPCTDAEGNWDPGEYCKEFQSDPQNATGSYPDCKVAVTVEPIASCGEPMTPDSSAAGAGALAGGAGSSGASAGTSLAGSGALAGSAGSLLVGGAGVGSAGMSGSAGAGLASTGATLMDLPSAMSTAAAGRGFGVQSPVGPQVGMSVSAVQAAGSSASFGVQPELSEESGEGCHVAHVGSGRRSFTGFGLVVMLFGGCVLRIRQRRRARGLGC